MFGDIGKLMQMISKLKTELPALKERLAAAEHSGDAGGGGITAKVNGKLQLIDLKISPEAAADCDAEMLADMIKAAIASAQAKAAEAGEAALKELTGGMDVPGLSGMM